MVLLHLDAFVGQNLTFSHQISVQLKTSEHFRAHFFVFRAQFLTKRRHFRPDPFLSCAERWQDLRAVRDSRGPCSEKGPFLARSPRGVFPNGCLRGISDAWRAYLAKASPFSDAWRAYPAIAGCLGMHSVDILPSADIRECAVSAYLHCRSSGRATFSTRGSGFRPLAALWGSARNTFCAREWAFRLLGA